MLNQLTQSTKLSQLILTAGLCLATVLAIQIVGEPTGGNRPATTATEKNLNENGLILNGTSLNGASLNGTSFNGTSLNGANLNGTGLSANGVHFKRFGSTSPTSVTAILNQKPMSKLHLEGGQLALKIKRSD
ncbi:pentapeptide repeat-containing protein [Chamaesiphon minutus]|uniref:Pentapeptide repeat protein n=1 Tax=Chamaesiphon minutus (strain ATCC 27169 / PCC 6605) TaxID=1173020 RepID=K9UEU0_CHAP6|nr:pentapeptide repeat-containing protein [Chamaesiphon minutus]AFY93325.1 pentapeptide repeat protein [Chamaesiphon minutus PCC 6605]